MRRWVLGAIILLAIWVLWPAVTLEWSIRASVKAELVLLALGTALPSALIGVLVDRWWAPTLAVVLVALPLIPERCVSEFDVDVRTHSCTGLGDEFAFAVAAAFGSLLAGTLAVAVVRSRRDARRGPGLVS